MEYLKLAKFIWWIILVITIGYFLVYPRFEAFKQGQATTMDIFVFLIWLALLLVPLFQEIDLFGVRLRKEIDSLRTDFKEQLLDLRTQIQNITLNVSPQYQTYYSMPESELSELQKTSRKTLENILKIRGIEKPLADVDKFKPEENVQYLFSIRYQLENELRRIWKEVTGEEAKHMGIIQMGIKLTKNHVISSELFATIREVNSICSLAIHGGSISDNKVHFVRDVASKLLTYLKAIY